MLVRYNSMETLYKDGYVEYKKYVFTNNIFLFVSRPRFSLPFYHPLDHNKDVKYYPFTEL